MSVLSDEELGCLFIGDSDDEGEVFEVFLQEDAADTESDLDIDPNAVLELEELDSDSDSDVESNDQCTGIDRLPDLPNQKWKDQLHGVSIFKFEEDVGVLHDLPVGATPMDYFSLFFSEDMFVKMRDETNLYARQVQCEKGRLDNNWQPASVNDIKLYIAINIMMGIHVLPRQENYWSSDDIINVQCISRLMSKTRFQKIGQYFHLNDRMNSQPRGHPEHDPLHKVRPVLDTFKEKCGKLYKPGHAISIDEVMVKFNGKLHFKQYTRSKPPPWGIKVWCCADPTSGYLLDFEVYTGKPKQPLKGGLGHHVVMTVGRNYLGKGHHFFHDSFFSSVTLAEDLLANNTHSCGTIHMNRKGWPDDLKTGKGKCKMQRGDVKFRQSGQMVATLWQDKHTIAVLSTNSDPVMGEASCQTGKGGRKVSVPQSIVNYNTSMGGVDLHDRHRAYYQVGRSCRKWWRYLFWFCVHSSIINAFIIFCKSNSPRPRSRRLQDPLYFRIAIFEGLVRGNVVKKRQVTMQPSVVGHANRDSTEHPLVRLPGRKKSCLQCLKMGHRQPCGHGRETVFGCTTCKAHLCKGQCFAQFHANLQQ